MTNNLNLRTVCTLSTIYIDNYKNYDEVFKQLGKYLIFFWMWKLTTLGEKSYPENLILYIFYLFNNSFYSSIDVLLSHRNEFYFFVTNLNLNFYFEGTHKKSYILTSLSVIFRYLFSVNMKYLMSTYFQEIFQCESKK